MSKIDVVRAPDGELVWQGKNRVLRYLFPDEKPALLAALLEDAGMKAVPVYEQTKKPHWCNSAGGCNDSWIVGGNYGSPICNNPNHHNPVSEDTP